jgi:hypothetical protein
LFPTATTRRVVPTPARGCLVVTVVLCATGGLALGAVWKMCEWVGYTVIDASIRVGYDDTIGDLAADLAGVTAAGSVAPWLAGDRRTVAFSDRPPRGTL